MLKINMRTISFLRIYMSHIIGIGWRGFYLTQVKEIKNKNSAVNQNLYKTVYVDTKEVILTNALVFLCQ